MDKNPRVSVLMPVYNGERYVREALDSILQQSFSGFEFIIINDGSTDHSAKIVQSYDDPRIRYFENEQNIGLTRSLNRGLSLARAPYVARMDADDVSLPQRLARQIDFLDTHPKVGVVGSAVQFIDERGKAYRMWRSLSAHEALRWCLCLYDPIMHPTVMMRRDVVGQVGGYNPDMVTAEDYDLWRRSSEVTHLSNLQDVLLYLRKHEASVTSNLLPEHWQNRVKISQMMLSEYLNEDVPIGIVQHIWSQNCGTVGDVRQAASLVRKLYEAGMANEALPVVEKRVIRKYVARRLLGLAHRRTNDGRAWDVVAFACRLDPMVVVKAVERRLRHLVRQRLSF